MLLGGERCVLTRVRVDPGGSTGWPTASPAAKAESVAEGCAPVRTTNETSNIVGPKRGAGESPHRRGGTPPSIEAVTAPGNHCPCRRRVVRRPTCQAIRLPGDQASRRAMSPWPGTGSHDATPASVYVPPGPGAVES